MPDAPAADAVKDAPVATAPAAAVTPASAAPAASGTTPVPAGASTAPAAQSGKPADPAPAKVEPKASDAPAAPKPKTLIVEDDAPAADAKPTDKAAEPAKPADWSLELPKDSNFSAEDVAAYDKSFKAAGLTKDAAQRLLTDQASMRKAEVSRAYEVWHDQAMKDPEIGGEKMPATLANVKRAMGAIFTPEERKAIANSPFANNPLFLRGMNRAAALIPVEDVVKAVGGQPVGKQMPQNSQEAARLMYPSAYE